MLLELKVELRRRSPGDLAGSGGCPLVSLPTTWEGSSRGQLDGMASVQTLSIVPYSSGPQPSWHQGPVSWKTVGGGGTHRRKEGAQVSFVRLLALRPRVGTPASRSSQATQAPVWRAHVFLSLVFGITHFRIQHPASLLTQDA